MANRKQLTSILTPWAAALLAGVVLWFFEPLNRVMSGSSLLAMFGAWLWTGGYKSLLSLVARVVEEVTECDVEQDVPDIDREVTKIRRSRRAADDEDFVTGSRQKSAPESSKSNSAFGDVDVFSSSGLTELLGSDRASKRFSAARADASATFDRSRLDAIFERKTGIFGLGYEGRKKAKKGKKKKNKQVETSSSSRVADGVAP